MLRSMTGFGRTAGLLGRYAAEVEIKSVNHRHCEVRVSLPRQIASLEMRAVNLVKERVDRGRLDVYLRLARNPEALPTPQVDRALATAIVGEARKLSGELDLSADLSLTALLQFPGVLSFEDETEDLEETWKQLAPILHAAVDALLESKGAEGAAIASDLLERINRLTQLSETIAGQADTVVQEYKVKLAERIRVLMENVDLDENRLASEAAYFADRADITEEVVRFRTHIQRFRELVDKNRAGKGYESVGRALDFVIQELFREANTMGSKSSSMEIINPALEIKAEIEKLREQVQNVE